MKKIFLLTVAVFAAAAALLASIALAQDGANFGNTCDVAWRGTQDPIMNPPQGEGHAHVGYGALSVTNADDGASLRNTPTSCSRQTNSSAYWHPEIYRDGSHEPLAVDTSKRLGDNTIYYRAGTLDPSLVRPFPANFEIISRDEGGPGTVRWGCEDGGGLTETVPDRCPTSTPRLIMNQTFPSCWDGIDRIARNPEDVRMPVGGACPDSHPRELPTITMSVSFILPTNDVGRITVAGDDPVDHQLPVGSMHADFVNGWDMQTGTDGAGLNELVERCITNQTADSTTANKPDICKDPLNPN